MVKETLNIEKERIALFGTGIVGDRVLRQLNGLHITPVIVYDNNSQKWGTEVKGISIADPSTITEDSFDQVVICTSDYYDEIHTQLTEKLGVSPDKIRHWTWWSRKDFLDHYLQQREQSSEEIRGIIDFVASNDRLEAINYPYIREEKGKAVCEKDETCGLLYTMYHGKRLYLKRSYQNKKVAELYVESLFQEQDERSPHRYLKEGFSVDGGVVLDAGAAEGNFALDVIEKIDHVFLVETDESWNEALKKTFEPWIDKITIINRFLSDKEDEGNTTIDSIDAVRKIDFIKMDIEGA